MDTADFPAVVRENKQNRLRLQIPGRAFKLFQEVNASGRQFSSDSVSRPVGNPLFAWFAKRNVFSVLFGRLVNSQPRSCNKFAGIKIRLGYADVSRLIFHLPIESECLPVFLAVEIEGLYRR